MCELSQLDVGSANSGLRYSYSARLGWVLFTSDVLPVPSRPFRPPLPAKLMLLFHERSSDRAAASGWPAQHFRAKGLVQKPQKNHFGIRITDRKMLFGSLSASHTTSPKYRCLVNGSALSLRLSDISLLCVYVLL